jgi:hypothetical protein
VSDNSRLAVFGSVDGLTMFLGLTAGLIVSRQGEAAIWHSALGGSAGELIGMTSGQWLSDRAAGWKAAVACGVAGAAACGLPAVPFLLASGTAARLGALACAVAVAGVISWLRPERGIAAIALTYGILAAAGILSGLTGLI